MKFPLTLSLMATALGSTVFIDGSAAAMPASTPLQIALLGAQTTEIPMVFVENGVGGASVLRRVSGDDDDHDDDCEEDDEYDDDDCPNQAAMPSGPITTPDNGLFSTGRAPQVKSN